MDKISLERLHNVALTYTIGEQRREGKTTCDADAVLRLFELNFGCVIILTNKLEDINFIMSKIMELFGNKFTINNDWKINENEYKCPICNEIFTKKGISSHYIFKHIRNNATLLPKGEKHPKFGKKGKKRYCYFHA